MNVDEKDRTIVKAAEEQWEGFSCSKLGSSDAAELGLYFDDIAVRYFDVLSLRFVGFTGAPEE